MAESEISHYLRKSLLIDTNIFLLIVIGTVDKSLISTFKRTNTFSSEDYDRLIEFLLLFDHYVITPNILTEVSNFLGQLSEPKRSEAFVTLGLLISKLVEIYVPSVTVAKSPNLIKYGLTDSTVIDNASNGVLTLTDDFGLYGKLKVSGKDAINFNHLRTIQPFSQ